MTNGSTRPTRPSCRDRPETSARAPTAADRTVETLGVGVPETTAWTPANPSGPGQAGAGRTVNDPSAGSPTETLLRLLLPLDSQV